ncbi:hypothetical protein DITRI_Ditri04bG0109100 [Diplodiscus trichospermus]
MASKSLATIALLLSLNLIFFSMANADIQLTECPNYDVNVCVNVLGLLGGGLTKDGSCCRLIANLVAAEAEVCLCAIVKANILGISLDVSAQLQLLLNDCDVHPTKTISCA